MLIAMLLAVGQPAQTRHNPYGDAYAYGEALQSAWLLERCAHGVADLKEASDRINSKLSELRSRATSSQVSGLNKSETKFRANIEFTDFAFCTPNPAETLAKAERDLSRFSEWLANYSPKR